MLTKFIGAIAISVGLMLSSTGCQDAETGPQTAVGCGLVNPRTITGLLGEDAVAKSRGTVELLQLRQNSISCQSRASEDDAVARYVGILVMRHAQPLRLTEKGCNAGWNYAGTPGHFAPSCQMDTPDGPRTLLWARSGDYIARVTIGRADHSWAGDPELALRITKEVGSRLRNSDWASSGPR